MTDAALLALLLDSPKLTEKQRKAFSSMLIELTPERSLTHGQREWAQGVGARLGLPGVGHPGRHVQAARVGYRSPWDPSESTRRMGGAALERYAIELDRSLPRRRQRRAAPRA